MSFIMNIHVDQVVSRYIPPSIVEQGPDIVLVAIRPLRIRHARNDPLRVRQFRAASQEDQDNNPSRRRRQITVKMPKLVNTDEDNNVTYTLICSETHEKLPIRLMTKEAAASEVRTHFYFQTMSGFAHTACKHHCVEMKLARGGLFDNLELFSGV